MTLPKLRFKPLAFHIRKWKRFCMNWKLKNSSRSGRNSLKQRIFATPAASRKCKPLPSYRFWRGCFSLKSKWNVASGIWQSDISIRHETVGSQRTWILLWNLNWPDQNHLEHWLHFTTLTGGWCEIYPKEDDQIVKVHRRFDPHPDRTLLGETRDRTRNREDPCSDAWRQIAICSNLEQR